MKCIIIYWSRYGHGEKLIRYLSERLEEKGLEVETFKPKETDPKNMSEGDIYVFSSPTEMFRIKKDMRKFMNDIENMEGKKYGIINTHGMKRSWLKNMDKILQKKKMSKLTEVDFKIGKEGAEEGKALPEDWKDRLDTFVEDILNGI